MKNRPVHLNLFAIHFPVTAWISIAHRVSGVVIFLLLPFALWLLQETLASTFQFRAIQIYLSRVEWKITLFILLASLLYHTLAGIRHLLMDLHLGDSKKTSVVTSWFVCGLFILGALLMGCWLW